MRSPQLRELPEGLPQAAEGNERYTSRGRCTRQPQLSPYVAGAATEAIAKHAYNSAKLGFWNGQQIEALHHYIRLGGEMVPPEAPGQ